MDQQHHGNTMGDDGSIVAQQYPYYAPEPEQYLGYQPQMSPYQVVQHPGPQTHLQQQQQQGLQQYHGLNLTTPHHFPSYSATPPHVPLAIPASTPPPPSPDMYDPLSPPISGSDTSADGLYHHNPSGQNSPSSSRSNSLVHRTHRYNPTPSPTSSSGRRSRGRSRDSDDDELDMGASFTENVAQNRKEATRRQRIEAEQRRRDELRDGYAKLKDVLPVSNQKSSKVNLLDRATQHIEYLERTNAEISQRLQAVEAELQRLRSLNEKISLTGNETSSPAMFNRRPLSPPPDVPLAGGTGLRSDLVSDESSASEGGY